MEPGKLKSGDPAPDFTAVDITGRKVRLSKYRGKKVLLAFLRYAGCPYCNVILQQLIKHYPIWKQKDLEVIVFVQSPKEHVEKRAVALKPQFSVIADPEMRYYKLYGVEVDQKKGMFSLLNVPSWIAVQIRNQMPQGRIDGSLFLMPAEFLINRNGTIYTAKYFARFDDYMPYIDITNFSLFG